MEKLIGERGIEIEKFSRDVLHGLNSRNKFIPSKYLYNKEGSRLFDEIMNVPEYYPSRCEFEILQNHKKQLLEYCKGVINTAIVDLGAGNGIKTMVLLNYFLDRVKFIYIPVDISFGALEELEHTMHEKFDYLPMELIHAEYMDALKQLQPRKNLRKLILFLGSTIGNFTLLEASHFLKELHDVLNPDDLVLIGFDIKKEPNIIRAAYNDVRGVTAKFNLNLLVRMNEELGADFNTDNFIFYPTYDPVTGEMKSYLVSTREQTVHISYLNKQFKFEAWEAIHTECSNKYDMNSIQSLAKRTGFEIEENFFDSKRYFTDSLWRVI